MAKAIILVGTWTHQQYCILENVTQVYFEIGNYGRLSQKVDLYICTMSGETFIVEKMKLRTAAEYINRMNAGGCLDLTESVDEWIYFARSA